MEYLKKFLEKQIQYYKKINTIEIDIGKIINQNLFDCKRDNFTNLIKKFRQYKLSYQQGKIYKYDDLILKTSNINPVYQYQNNLIERLQIKMDKFDLNVKNIEKKNIDNFPNKIDYLDEYEYDEIIVTIDQNFLIHFQNYNGNYFIKIKITLEKDLPYNFIDKIIDHFDVIFSLI